MPKQRSLQPPTPPQAAIRRTLLRRSRQDLVYTTALQAAAMVVLAVPAFGQAAPPANALPTNPTVVVGAASFNNARTPNTITQTTARTAINWQSFNVGSAQTVTFNQPNAAAIALNRVTGADPSLIAGKINANGQLALVNQSGVVFFKGAQVNAASLMVSAADITNANFAAGHMVFDVPAHANAKIDNQAGSTLTVSDTGLAALVAPQVANGGTITAKLGHVVLAGAVTYALDLFGDGLLSIGVNDRVTQAPVGPDGKKVAVLVSNSGTITADGGTITLTAREVDGLVQNLVTSTGTLQANSAVTQAGVAKVGTIQVGGVGGSVTIDGSVLAQGLAAGTKGGNIAIAASNQTAAGASVTLGATAVVDASGVAGGGVVAVGATLPSPSGHPRAIVAQHTVVTRGAAIKGDATSTLAAGADGGQVAVLSTKSTTLAGTISAHGGKLAGHGGTAQVASTQALAMSGTVDLSAAAAANVGTATLGAATLIVGDAAGASVTLGALNGSSANFALTATQGLSLVQTATDPVQLNTLSLGANSLSLTAGTALSVDRGMTLNAGSVSLTGASVALGVTGAATAAAAVNAGTVAMTARTGSITLTDTQIGNTGNTQAASVSLTSSKGGISQTAKGVIRAATLTGGAGGTAALLGTGNQITNLGNFASGGSFTLVDGQALGLTGALSGGIVRLATTGTLTETGAGTITATTLTGRAGGTVSLDGTNAVTNLASFTTPGDFSLTNGGSLTVTGIVQAGPTVVPSVKAASTATLTLTTSGDLTIGTGGQLIGNTVNLVTTANAATHAAGNVTETGTGRIDAHTLTGRVAGGATLAGANAVAQMGAFRAGGDLTFKDAQSLTIGGLVQATPTLALTIAGDLAIGADGQLAAGTVDLVTSGTQTEDVKGQIRATTLTGRAGGGVTLTGTNAVANLARFTTPADFSLTDAQSLTVTGLVQAGTTAFPSIKPASTATLTLTTDGDLTIGTGGALIGNTVNLVTTANAATHAPGDILESGTGRIDAHTLTGNAAGKVTLSGANAMAELAAFRAGGDLRLSDRQSLTVTGLAQAGGDNPSLGALATPTLALTIAGDLTIGTGGQLVGGTVDLITTANAAIGATGAQTETGTGTIDAHTLTGRAAGDVTLDGTNAVAELAGFTTPGNFALTDRQSLTVNGVVQAGPANPAAATPTLSLHVTQGDLAIASGGALIGGTVHLVTQGGQTETGTGRIAAHVLTGSAGGSVTFGTATNAVASLDAYTAGGGFALTDFTAAGAGNLDVTGAVSVGAGQSLALVAPSLTLLAGGSLTADAAIAGGTVTPGLIALQANAMSLAAGTVNAPDGTVAITTLRHGAITLDAAKVAGHLSLTQADLNAIHTLGVGTGTLGTQTLALGSLDGATTSANATLLQINTAIDLTGTARTLALFSSGDVTEDGAGAPGSVTVHALTGNAGGAVALDGANRIDQTGNLATLGGFTTNGRAAVANLTAQHNISLLNTQDLTILTGLRSAQDVSVDVLGGNLTVSTADPAPAGLGQVTGRNVSLHAGDGATAGSIVVGGTTATISGESIFATGTLDLVAGLDATPGTAPLAGAAASAGNIAINGRIHAATVGLYSANDTTEAGTIIAARLQGQAGQAPSLAGAGTFGSATLTGGTGTKANQVTALGDYATTGNFTLNDGRALLVSGAVSAGLATAATPGAPAHPATATITVPDHALTVTGSVTAGVPVLAGQATRGGNVTLTGKGIILHGAAGAAQRSGAVIALAGAQGGGTVTMTSGGTITEDALGYLQASELTGSSLGTASFAGGAAGAANANAVATLGAFTTGAGAGFLLRDSGDLTVTGKLTAGGDATILAQAGNLTTDAAVQAGGNATLAAHLDLTNNGGIGAGAGADAILSAGRDVRNNAAVVAQHDARLTAGRDIIDQGGIAAGGTARLVAQRNIQQLAHGISAGAAGSAGTPSISLIASTGSITQAAGAAITATDATGLVSLTARGAIDDAGSILAGGDVALTAQTGSITDGGGITATNGSATLTAGGSILNQATIVAGQAATLTAQAGNITDSGGITAGTTAALTAHGNITQRSHSISAAGADQAGQPSVALLAQSGTISQLAGAAIVAGNTGGSVALTAAQSIVVAGSIEAGADATLTAQGGNIAQSGGVTAHAGNATLTASGSIINDAALVAGRAATLTAQGGSITDRGGVRAGTVATLAARTDITQLARSINAGTAATLTAGGTISQSAGASITGAGPVTLTAGGAIVDAGIITAGTDATLVASTTITQGGTITATAGNATLTAGTGITSNGALTSGRAASLTATAGDINEQGGITAGTTATLAAGGAINQTGGAILAGTDATLSAGGAITQGGTITATAGNATLTAGTGITGNGAITSGRAASLTASAGDINEQGGITAGTTATLTAGGAINQTGGTITAATPGQAGTPSIALLARGGAISQATGAALVATDAAGTITLDAATGMALGGTVAAAGGAGQVTLTARGGDIGQTSNGTRSGVIDTATLTGSASGNLTLDNPANRIATIATLSAGTGAVTLANATALSVQGAVSAATSASITNLDALTIAGTGSVTAPTVQLAATDLSILGSVTDAASVTLTATRGGITETGALTANILDATAPGAITLVGATPQTNQVATLRNVRGASLLLNNGRDLTVAGTITAPSIHINDNQFTVTLADGSVLQTGSGGRGSGKVAFASLPTYLTGQPGAYIEAGGLRQFGRTVVEGIGGATPTLRIDLTTPAGTIAFDPASGLDAGTADLILNLGGGRATGRIAVKNLDVSFVASPAGGTALSGSINGLGGSSAAGFGDIAPQSDPKYQINACPITAVNCVLLSVAVVPIANPLQDINIGVLGDSRRDDDLLLPDVSQQDY